MPNTNSIKPEWHKFDTDTLPEDLSNLLHNYRELEAKANSAKREFTAAFVTAAEEAGLGAPEGHDMVVSLKFNDISLGYVPAKQKKAQQNRVGFNTSTVRAKGGKRLSPKK